MQQLTASQALADLNTLDRSDLIQNWQKLFTSPVPKGLSKPFLRRLIAIELQSQQLGGLPKRVIAALSDTDDRSHATSPALKPGGRLIREWNGVSHVVDVTDDGFRWKGGTYRSLSAIAQEITGAHWSGPRFFGLNKKAAR